MTTLARLALFGAIGVVLFLPLLAKRPYRHRHRHGGARQLARKRHH